ncbi:hypothetical protein AB3S75_000482 [Citrus x aurantiifolia]
MENLLGYKFQPSNEQILYLLVEKRLDPHFSYHPIKDIVDICSLEPWDLATESKTESEDQVWYFFCEPYYKYRKSNRAHRRTKTGHWKITSRVSKIEARNGLTGIKKILTFYRHGLASKEAITEWVMHEYHVTDDPRYKKEFVFSRIERKQKKKKHGTSTTDEGESCKQLVSPPQQSRSDHSFSYRNHSEEQTLTNSGQQLQNQIFSYPGNLIQQDTITYPQSINPVLPPNSNLELQLPLDHPSVTHNFGENDFQGENLPIGEFNLYGGYNRLNEAFFSAVQRPIYQEQEFIYSNSSFDSFDFPDCLIGSDEQVNYLIKSSRAFQDENSCEETGQTLFPGFNPSKSDGKASACVVNSSDTNTACSDAWIQELLENFLK